MKKIIAVTIVLALAPTTLLQACGGYGSPELIRKLQVQKLALLQLDCSYRGTNSTQSKFINPPLPGLTKTK